MTLTIDRPDPSAEAAPTAPVRVPRRHRGNVDPIPWWLAVVGVVVALYFILPTLVVIPLSFTSSDAFDFPPQGFSLRWYANFFTDPAWIGSLGNSVLVLTAHFG